MKRLVLSIACASLFWQASVVYAAKDETVTALADQKSVAVTIYNGDLALVKDSRNVNLRSGAGALAWRDVSAQIRPETALVRNTSGAQGFHVLEQNFDFDLLTPQALVEKYVGKKVRIIKTNPATGAESSEEALVLSANQGVVLQFADRVESHPPGRVAFGAVPDNLRDRPTLVMKLNAPNGGNQDLELSYLTGGLNWKADYVAELSGNDDKLQLNGWVTLTNQSGASYNNARLQLVAGDVNRVQDAMGAAVAMAPVAAERRMANQVQMKEESLFEYHLYTLDRLTTISDNQTKQVALVSAANVPVKKELLLRGLDYYYMSSYGDLGQKLKVGVFVEFDNKGGNLGVPLPKGVVRVYKKDSAGNAQFVGEDRIDHTPKNEKVRLKLGESFDVTANKKQTKFQKQSGDGPYNYVYDASFQIELKNAKSEAMTVTVQEPIPGDWQMLTESHPHKKATSNTAVWTVTVPAEGTATLNYKVRVRH